MAILRKKKEDPAHCGGEGWNNTVPFNKEVTWWLGVWLDSQLTLKDNHAIRAESGKNAMARLHRLAGQTGLSLANCRKAMTACIQSVAVFGSELWRKGDQTRGTIGQATSSSSSPRGITSWRKAAASPGGTYIERRVGPLPSGRCSQVVLDLFSTMDVGRLVPAEEDAGSEVLDWELREREEERRAEAEE